MSEASIHEDLRALARTLDRVSPPAELRGRVLDAAMPTSARPQRRWVAPALAFASGVLVTLALRATTSSSAVSDPHPVAIATPASGARATCDPALGTEPAAIASPCRFDVEEIGVGLDVWTPARLARTGRRLVLVEGSVTFDVEPVGDAPPIEIDVGAGIVRVLGTRFDIQNTGDTGHLDLIHGRVEFHDRAGGVREVIPGVRLSWDRRADTTPPSVPAHATAPLDAPRPPSATLDVPAPDTGSPTRPRSGRPRVPAPPTTHPDTEATTDDLEALLDAVARHRLAGEHAEAEALLRDALARIDVASTAEVLSFELGTLLELAEGAPRACEHWRAHADRFAGGSSRARVAAHRVQLGCGGDE